MSKSITIICNSYPPEKGAAPTRIYNLAKMLKSRGYDVEVIAAMPNYPTGRIFKGYRNKLIHREESEGIKIRRLWLIPSNSKLPLSRALSMITQSVGLYLLGLPGLLFKRPQIILVSSPPILLGYHGIVMAKLLRVKTVLNISDIWPLSALELGAIKKGRFYNLMERLEKRMYSLSHVCVGQSKEILDRVEEVLPGAKQRFLYRNLQDVSAYACQPKPAGKKKIVYAGMLGIAQGIYEICTAINFNALGVELHIYGEGFEKDKITELIEKNPERGIFYHGSIPGIEVPEMLSRHHATLIPLKTMIHGAVPSKIFMAMANAIPVFFSGSGEGAAIVQETGIGWVNAPSDFGALVENIRQMSTMPEPDYEAIRNRCLEVMNNEFNKTRQDDAFDQFLRSIC